MRSVILVLVVGMMLLASCTSAHRSLSHKAMHKDLYRLERVIRKTHPAVNRIVSDSSLLSLRDKIAIRLPAEASVLEFAQLTSPLINAVQCGHIGIYPRGALWRSSFARSKHSFPLSLKQLDDGWIALEELPSGLDSSVTNAFVLEINGRPISEFVEEAIVFKGGSDGINRSGARNRAVTKLPQHLRWTLGKQDSFKVKLWLADRNIIIKDTVLTVASKGTRSNNQAKNDRRSKKDEKTINYGFDASRKVAVVDLNSFSGYDAFNIIFPMALKKVLAKAEKDSAQTLILDLRDNGGGRSSNILRVLRYFIEEETEIFGPWTFPKSGWKHSNLPYKLVLAPSLVFDKGEHGRFGRMMRHKIKPRKKGFGGKVIVLIDSGTFSAASITASILKSTDRASILGQEAGGNYHETYAGLFSMIALRRTGLKLRMPHFLIPVQVDERKQPFGKTLQPDIEIPVTIDDVIDPRDRLLLHALELTKG